MFSTPYPSIPGPGLRRSGPSPARRRRRRPDSRSRALDFRRRTL